MTTVDPSLPRPDIQILRPGHGGVCHRPDLFECYWRSEGCDDRRLHFWSRRLFTYKVVGLLKKAENEDYFDHDTDFTPFSIRV